MGTWMEAWREEWWDGGMVGWIHLLVVRVLSLAQTLLSPVDACFPARGPESFSEGHNVQYNPAWIG